ncbi:Xaa-Pro peptidase family protein [Acidipila sp. EB88]|uniref:M24 family metallopeptidase n=1 Tax=Acidipila sp. EB88 TaxID=2305226 RepID=UPI000F5F0DF6|nr:Xaa-Pro peptidase family protein [Acidipila sp. EB88]RRA48481.1 aminopeptidase P family protein [Acidipila sp. EB88]
MSSLRRVCLFLLLLAASHAFALDSVPKAEYHARRVQLAEALKGSSLLTFGRPEAPEEYQQWRQQDDFYYLTGWNEPGAALLIVPARPARPPATLTSAGIPATPYREILFLPERNLRLELYTGVKLDANTPNAAAIAGFDEVRQLKDLPSVLVSLKDSGPLVSDDGDTRAEAAQVLFGATLGRAEAAPQTQPILGYTTKLRLYKSPAEAELLKKAAAASVDAQLAMMQNTHDGQRERTLSGILDLHFKEGGCERPAYPSIVGSGIHSTELHYSDDADTLHAGDLLLVDAACEYSMYAMDLTRTVPVNGHFTPRQREIYNIVLGAQQAAINSFNATKSNAKRRSTSDPDSLDYVAAQYISTHGKDLHGESLGKYFIHGVGHAVGINVHDPQQSDNVWGPGTVFTIEPGIYIPEERIGVRIEDTFYVDPAGKLVCLTCALPRSAEAVEAIVQKGAAPAGSPSRSIKAGR